MGALWGGGTGRTVRVVHGVQYEYEAEQQGDIHEDFVRREVYECSLSSSAVSQLRGRDGLAMSQLSERRVFKNW